MIVIRIWEGLGNQLFQYAFARKLQTMGKEVYLDTTEDHFTDYSYFYSTRKYSLDFFPLKIQQASPQILQNFDFIKRNTRTDQIIYDLSVTGLWKYKYIEEKHLLDFREEYYRLRGNYYIKGLFQRPSFIQDIRETLIKEIRPINKIKISKQLSTILNAPNTVSVHVRKGDYKISPHSYLPMQYYKKAIEYADSHISNAQYLFFSTDMDWVKEGLGKKDNYFYIDELGKFEDYEELLIMSRCANNIITNSTFSWWAAWLNQNVNKIVLAPNGWSGSKIISDYIVLKDWIRI